MTTPVLTSECIMITSGIPIITAYLNHYWRGQGNAPRWAFYGFMWVIAYCVSLDAVLACEWL
jgi:hypothetical protein